jgi:CRISPR system Cascade subunit CasD
MSTLLLRLAAPLQSWGVDSKFDRRLTENEPTRSGIVGMLACAMGIRRGESLAIFDTIKFGVRKDQEGKLGVDYQTARKEKSAKNSTAWVTNRYYLLDAIFLVGIEGEQALLEKFAQALVHPVFPIYLGRRSCPPAGQVCMGIRNTNLREALQKEPWLASDWYKRYAKRQKTTYLEIVRDAAESDTTSYPVRDVPITFSQERRKYSFRNVAREHIPLKNVWQESQKEMTVNMETNHDPMSMWEENDVPIKD